ncbi:hypothetical protein DPMN_044396 [Dreissena polymorpha]|uniref:Uncharacterized protein n=1 Tax=Dreissena polymorpha TaxID=45954 RepID=A0A9D4I0H0_DREPO|nr:hypothetical protein DPMN_044396 [Dreissena polymorpha]
MTIPRDKREVCSWKLCQKGPRPQEVGLPPHRTVCHVYCPMICIPYHRLSDHSYVPYVTFKYQINIQVQTSRNSAVEFQTLQQNDT